ncbi:MAG: DUF4150 domain-containing protein [Polyangiaceae bacterium]
MFPISTTMNGQCMAMPDVCKTPAPPGPPIPLPYPNIALVMQATPSTASKKVKVLEKPAVLLNTKIPMSSGDEAGSAGGVVSGTIKGPVGFTQGSTKVKIEGQPVVYATCPTAHNGSNPNAPCGHQVSPSQSKVLVRG